MNPWWQVVLANALVAALAGILVTGITRIWRNPSLAHVLWALVLLKLVTPPIVSVPVASVPIGRFVPADDFAAPSADETRFALAPGESGEAIPASHDIAAADGDSPQLKPGNDSSAIAWPSVLAGVWGLGTAIWVGLLAIRTLTFNRLVRATPPAADAWQQEVARLAARLDLRAWPSVRLAEGAIPPLLWTLGRRPLIVLPRTLVENLDTAQRRALLAHELAHYYRRDHWMRWFEMAVLAVCWWNPVAWWGCRQMQIAEEQCCDGWAVWLLDGQSRLYGRTLLTTIDFLSDARVTAPLGASAVGRMGSLKQRFEMILDQPFVRRLSVSTWLVVVPLATLVLCVSLCLRPSDRSWSLSQSSSPARDEAGGLAGIELAGKSYELISIDDLPAARILEQARQHHGVFWEKRFADDLVEIMDRLGQRPAETVKLLVRDPASGKTKTFDHAQIGDERGAHVFVAIRNDRGNVAPHSQGWAKLSPFTCVGTQFKSAEVKFDGQRYALISIDDLPTSEILAAARRFEGSRWMKHFAENLVEVMEQMGHRPGPTVKLVLQDPTTGETRTVERAPMTAENHAQVFATRLDWLDGEARPRLEAIQLSPFTKVFISGETADVEFAGNSYQLISIDNLPTAEILDGARQYYGKGWTRCFAENLVQLLDRMGHPPADTVKLVLRDRQSRKAQTIDHAPLTAENYAKVCAAAHTE